MSLTSKKNDAVIVRLSVPATFKTTTLQRALTVLTERLFTRDEENLMNPNQVYIQTVCTDVGQAQECLNRLKNAGFTAYMGTLRLMDSGIEGSDTPTHPMM